MSAPEVTAETLTDAEIRAFRSELAIEDTLRFACNADLSTDWCRRFNHESKDAFAERRKQHAESRTRIAAAINARKAALLPALSKVRP